LLDPDGGTDDALDAALRAARVARLATVDREGNPHVVPVCFAYDGSSFYTAIDRKPKRVAPGGLARLRHIDAHDRVALLIDAYDEDWSRLWYVLARGKATRLSESDARERVKALSLLRTKYPQYASGLLPDDAIVIRIQPERISTWGRPDGELKPRAASPAASD
jgi:PPOX class probable F420-dependent enzyme